MQKYILLICFVCIFTAAWAGNSFEAAYEVSSYTYKEPDGNMPIKLHGMLQGASAVFKHSMEYNNMFWAADFRAKISFFGI